MQVFFLSIYGTENKLKSHLHGPQLQDEILLVSVQQDCWALRARRGAGVQELFPPGPVLGSVWYCDLFSQRLL